MEESKKKTTVESEVRDPQEFLRLESVIQKNPQYVECEFIF